MTVGRALKAKGVNEDYQVLISVDALVWRSKAGLDDILKAYSISERFEAVCLFKLF